MIMGASEMESRLACGLQKPPRAIVTAPGDIKNRPRLNANVGSTILLFHLFIRMWMLEKQHCF
jgi:hypothetical protein